MKKSTFYPQIILANRRVGYVESYLHINVSKLFRVIGLFLPLSH